MLSEKLLAAIYSEQQAQTNLLTVLASLTITRGEPDLSLQHDMEATLKVLERNREKVRRMVHGSEISLE